MLKELERAAARHLKNKLDTTAFWPIRDTDIVAIVDQNGVFYTSLIQIEIKIDGNEVIFTHDRRAFWNGENFASGPLWYVTLCTYERIQTDLHSGGRKRSIVFKIEKRGFIEANETELLETLKNISEAAGINNYKEITSELDPAIKAIRQKHDRKYNI